MTGYVRTDTSDNIANNKIASAEDLDNEFNALESAFTSSAGHTHDGTVGSGAPITRLGPAQDLIISATAVTPKNTTIVDLGSSASKFKDLHIGGVGTLNSLVATTADINGGTLDGVAIGASVPSTVVGTTITGTSFVGPLTGAVTGNITSTGTSTFTTVDINGGAVDGTTVGLTTPATGRFTTFQTTGDAAVGGNLGVTGNLTATTLIADSISLKGLTLALNSDEAGTPSQNVGLEIERGTSANKSLLWDETADVWTVGTDTFVAGAFTGSLTGNASTATTLATTRAITLAGDVTGTVNFNGSADVTINTTVAANSVALGTDTTGNYVAAIAGTANQITATGSGAESATVTLSLPTAITFPGSTTTVGNATVNGNLTVLGTTTSSSTTTVNLGDSILILNADEVGTPTQNAGIEIERGTSVNKSLLWDETADRWTVGAETFVAGSFIGPVTGNVTGNATTATTLATARSVSLSGTVTGTTSFNGSADVTIATTIAANAVTLGTHTVGNYVATVAGTANQLTVTGSGTETSAVTVSLPSAVITPGSLQTTGDLTVGGNLTVNGLTTTINSTTVNIGDNIINLNSGVVGTPSTNAGIRVNRGTSLAKEFIWDEAVDRWTVGAEAIVAGSFIGPLTGNVTGTVSGNVTGDLTGNVTGNLTGNVTGTASNATTAVTLTGLTSTVTELNFVDGVTSNVQTQLNTKAPSASPTLTTPTLSGAITVTGGTASWTATASGTNLTFAYGGVNKMRIDSSGNLTVVGNVTAYGVL